MAVFEFWRTITSGSPFDTVNRYRYDTDDDTVEHDSFNVPTGNLGSIMPPVGTLLYTMCQGLDRVQYFSIGNNSGVNKVTFEDHPVCCTLSISDFSVAKTNNTNLLTPNGTIVVTSVTLDIGDYEASIDGGANWVSASAGAITFTGVMGGNYSVIIKDSDGVCSVSAAVVIVDIITYPPLIISENTLPDLYAPVFYPITIGFLLDNNDAAVKQDSNGTYLQVSTQDGKDYLATLPIIKIFDNADYEGTYQVTEVDDPDDPQKFYIDADYTTDQNVLFVPFDRQVFQVFAEKTFNVYEKIADLAVYPDATGEYKMRIEGYLQAVFKVNPPVNNGDEITLLRKYYVVPRDFDMESAPTVLNAVYSAVPSITPFLDEQIPLGPAPINFINEQTSKGLPVLFSYIETSTGRVVNITSSEQTDVVSTQEVVYVPGLPLNSYDVTWVNPAGVIASLNTDPALPSWITLLSSASDTVKLHIDTGVEVEGGDYSFEDYSSSDYLTGGVNAIVGCYEFEFFDGETLLFTLRICVFPIQKSNGICPDNVFNIAWVNREGGWSSYLFEGKKVFGKDIGEVRTYKSDGILKRSAVEEVYDTVEINISNKNYRDLEFIASLRQSIQAFLYSEQTQSWSIPIFLDRAAFPIYSRPFKQAEVNERFTFRYATEIVIQTQ